MRKNEAMVIMVTFVLSFVSNPVEAGIGARVYGGFSHISYSDYNDWVDSENEKLVVLLNKKIDKMKWVPEFGAELFYPVMPNIDLGLGAGLIMGSTEYSVSGPTFSYDINHGIKAFPITANIYFRPVVPFSSMKPYVYGGGGLYYSKIDFEFRTFDGVDVDGYEAELTAWGYGIHGGGGIEFSIVPTFSLDIGFKLRWADISGFEGTRTNADGETYDAYLASDTVAGTLIYEVISTEYKDDYDEGSVDLTGFTFYMGFKAGF